MERHLRRVVEKNSSPRVRSRGLRSQPASWPRRRPAVRFEAQGRPSTPSHSTHQVPRGVRSWLLSVRYERDESSSYAEILFATMPLRERGCRSRRPRCPCPVGTGLRPHRCLVAPTTRRPCSSRPRSRGTPRSSSSCARRASDRPRLQENGPMRKIIGIMIGATLAIVAVMTWFNLGIQGVEPNRHRAEDERQRGDGRRARHVPEALHARALHALGAPLTAAPTGEQTNAQDHRR